MRAIALQAVSDAVHWGSQAEKLGIIGILVVCFALFVIALFREWLVLGKTHRLEREEKIMWRTAYMELRGTTRHITEVAKSAVEKVVQP